jgi:predicted transcriptional regulator
MNTITIALPDDRFGRLKELALRLGVTPEDLARAGIEDLLARPDDTFRQALDDLLRKNTDLYQRLAAL